MKTKTFVVAGVALFALGLGPATSGPCTSEIDALAKSLSAKDAGAGPTIGALGHVWTAPAVQEESDYQRSVRVRSCIRPLSAAVWPLALM